MNGLNSILIRISFQRAENLTHKLTLRYQTTENPDKDLAYLRQTYHHE